MAAYIRQERISYVPKPRSDDDQDSKPTIEERSMLDTFGESNWRWVIAIAVALLLVGGGFCGLNWANKRDISARVAQMHLAHHSMTQIALRY